MDRISLPTGVKLVHRPARGPTTDTRTYLLFSQVNLVRMTDGLQEYDFPNGLNL